MNNEERVVVVTGASRGIGRCIAMCLGTLGYTVIGTATTEEGAAAISNYLDQQNSLGAGMQLNVCDEESVKVFVKTVVATYGGISVLVNNAGVTDDNVFLRMKPAQWDKVIETNLTSIYRMTKLCLKPMFRARWGRVVNITSVVAATGNPGQANYCAAKAGMIGFTKSLALEMAAFGVTFNAVAPGFIQTDMTDALNDEQQQAILQQIPMGKMGTPEDIANTVAFLISEQAGYITGQTMHVNGGMFFGV